MSEPIAAPTAPAPEEPRDFIREIVTADLAAGRHGAIVTRFPPEPNGYLHIGHAKSICLNFGIARDFGGRCHLRMDDTNPAKEDVEYVDSITEDVHWLIHGWADHVLTLKPRGARPALTIVGDDRTDPHQSGVTGGAASAEDSGTSHGSAALEPFYASDYFEALYQFAETLVLRGKAYVCDLTAEDMDAYRGAPDRPGKESPWRGRSVEESLDLLRRMRKGEFPDGARTLRARIDMTSPNVWLRDPVLYRIRHVEHHQTGASWCIYPMYDFAHCLSDYVEGITHSICTLEFEVHRPLYDWILGNLDLPRALPRQYEFARLNLSYTVMSKRKLLQLVNEDRVSGWDDPRMPTLAGLRRRGVRAEALREFARVIGVTKFDGLTDVALLEHCIRGDLNGIALRRLAVLRPLKVVLTNLPVGHSEEVQATNNPEDPAAGSRAVAFGREIFIDREDFEENPPPKYFRLRPGGEVRLKYLGIILCTEVVKDDAGNVVELRCTLDEGSRTGGPTAGRKVKGTIHWVDAATAIDAEVRLYDRLFTVPEPDGDGDFRQHLNPRSLEVLQAKVEPSLATAVPGENYQFERVGYFCADADAGSVSGNGFVFNRTISLKDAPSKEGKKK
ncbi:MAG: glutamine--tRNA ligase [Limisphaerales bacterium]